MKPIRPAINSTGTPKRAWVRIFVLVLGLVIPQVLMYWPSMVGLKILLPLDLLAQPNVYLPQTPEYQKARPPHNPILSDQVLCLEFERRFAAKEFRAGRLPIWVPDHFAGAPFAVWGKYSPLNVIYYAWPSPYALVWTQLIKSLVAGIGAYVFFRLALRVGFWAAAFGAWALPLTSFFVLWQGFQLTNVVVWLPWLLLLVDRTVRRPFGWGGIGLALLTALTIISGQVGMAGQMLLTSGIFALWCLWDEHRSTIRWPRLAGSALALGSGWTLGFLLSMPYLQPLVEYVDTGNRPQLRASGVEIRPPLGLVALPPIVLPDIDGRRQRGYAWLAESGTRMRNGATAYTGLIITLLLAPLAWTQRQHLSGNLMWLLLGVLGVSWRLNIPGLVTLWRMPGLNMLSMDRFDCVTSFAILSLAVIGLDAVWRNRMDRRWWYLASAVLVIGLGSWCVYRSINLPEPLATELEQQILRGRVGSSVNTLEKLDVAKYNFSRSYLVVVGLTGLTAACWILIWLKRHSRPWFIPLLGAVAVADLLWYAHDVNPQCNASLYYPSIPTLQKLAEAPPGRVLGYFCLPSRLAETHGLRDLRGYDRIDPSRLMDLMRLAAHPESRGSRASLTQWYAPKVSLEEQGTIRLHPVLDMLNVRYVIFRGSPPKMVTPWLAGDDYWILRNPKVMPRVFVPMRVETLKDKSQRLRRLAATDFDPREVGFVEQPIDLPEACHGTAEIRSEIPRRVTVAAHMKTPGMLVLADMWDKGWLARVNGKPMPIVRVNHVLRGVVVPQGTSEVVFEYQPASLARGVWMMLAGVLALMLWFAWCWTRRKHDSLAGPVSSHGLMKGST